MRRSPLPSRFQPGARLRWLLLAFASLLVALLLQPGPLSQSPAMAQQAGYGQTMGGSQTERQFYDYGPSTGSSGGSGGSLFNSTNPMDLMNKLRRTSALDEATTPTSAVDQALKDLEAQSAGPSAQGPASTVKAP